MWGGGVVDQVRLSQDNTNNLIQLDIHINSFAAADTGLNAQYEGAFAPVASASIAVGATVLPTWSTVLQVYPTPIYQANQQVSFTAGSSGWYTIATTWALQGLQHVYMAGHVKYYGADGVNDITLGEAVLENVTSGKTPLFTRVYDQGAGNVIAALRASTDDTGHNGQLDAEIAYWSTPAQVTFWLDGFFTPFPAPVAGATAPATTSTVLSLT